MGNQKYWKFSLPALLMSAFAFELMPGSVRYYSADLVAAPEAAYNFFELQLENSAMMMAMVAAFSKKYPIFKMVGWTSLIAAAFTAAPYMLMSDGSLLQPNVVVTILLTACWLIGMMLEKKKTDPQEEKPKGRHL